MVRRRKHTVSSVRAREETGVPFVSVVVKWFMFSSHCRVAVLQVSKRDKKERFFKFKIGMKRTGVEKRKSIGGHIYIYIPRSYSFHSPFCFCRFFTRCD